MEVIRAIVRFVCAFAEGSAMSPALSLGVNSSVVILDLDARYYIDSHPRAWFFLAPRNLIGPKNFR